MPGKQQDVWLQKIAFRLIAVPDGTSPYHLQKKRRKLMNLHLVALNGFIAPGEPCRENVLHDLNDRALRADEIDDLTHTRAMRATMTVTNHDDLRFEFICEQQDIDKAKQTLVRLINIETHARYERHQGIAAFADN